MKLVRRKRKKELGSTVQAMDLGIHGLGLEKLRNGKGTEQRGESWLCVELRKNVFFFLMMMVREKCLRYVVFAGINLRERGIFVQ